MMEDIASTHLFRNGAYRRYTNTTNLVTPDKPLRRYRENYHV